MLADAEDKKPNGDFRGAPLRFSPIISIIYYLIYQIHIMKKYSIILTLVVALIFMGFRPNHVSHLDELKVAFKKENPLLALFKIEHGIDLVTEYKDYYFFTMVVYKNGAERDIQPGQVVSIGFLNEVFILRNLDVDA